MDGTEHFVLFHPSERRSYHQVRPVVGGAVDVSCQKVG